MADITISLNQLEAIVSRAVNVGRVEMMNQYLPQSKYISKPQLLIYLRTLGIKPGAVDEWMRKGLLHDIQTGSGGTHKFSRLEVQKALLLCEVSRNLC